MCTHLHADHVGWNTRLVNGRWVPTFPNARYLLGRREYAYWETAEGPAATGFGQESVFSDSVLPCVEAGQVQFVDNGFELDDALLVEDAPGHTPGTAIIRARSRGRGGLFIGDIMHTPLQVLYPDANSRADIDPEQSRVTRKRVLSECAEHGHLLLPAHFGPPFYGRVTHDGSAYTFQPGE
jgi:glyoxylase-like metal-dependent hydrolase (beta-lactamase superfamily II)